MQVFWTVLLMLLIRRQNCCLLFCQRLVRSAIFFYFKVRSILRINWISLKGEKKVQYMKELQQRKKETMTL